METYIWFPQDIYIKRHTTTAVENNTEALGHYGLTMTFLVDHDYHELTMTLMI